MEERGGAFDGVGDVVECSTYAYGDLYGWHFVKVAGDPFFLGRGSICDKQNVWIGIVDEIFYFFLFVN